MRRAFIGFVMVVVVGFAAAGCGGSGSDWTTVATLRSSDPPDAAGRVASRPFMTSNRVRFVLDTPGAAPADGVAGTLVPADQFAALSAFVDEMTQVKDRQSVTLGESLETQELSGLNGSYVLVVPAPGPKPWSVEIQTSD